MNQDVSEQDLARPTAFYPAAQISPVEFEEWVGQILRVGGAILENYVVAVHDEIVGTDGSFEFDATVRFRVGGLDFLVLVEAKRHRNPIKRELVQILYQKLLSVGAQKAVMVATAPFQRGALDYAKVHNIALVTVTEGRFIMETRSADGRSATSPLTVEQARERHLPDFVGHAYREGTSPGSTAVTLITAGRPGVVTRELFGLSLGGADA